MSDNRAVAIMPFKFNRETVYRVGIVSADWELNCVVDSDKFWVCMDENTTTPDFDYANWVAAELSKETEYGVYVNETFINMDHRAIDDYCEAIQEARQELIDGEQPRV